MSLNISSIQLSDSFNTWRLRTNSIISRAAQATGSANNTANTVNSGRHTFSNLTTFTANTSHSGTFTHTGTFAGSKITAANVTATYLSAANVNSTVVTATTVTATTVTATDFNSTSDVRLKVNVNKIDNSLNKVCQLSGVRFNWKDTNVPSIGLIAQEVEQIIPEVVHQNEQGYKTINYGLLVAVLIEAIKQQQVIINNLK